jgi:hypothetical protein
MHSAGKQEVKANIFSEPVCMGEGERGIDWREKCNFFFFFFFYNFNVLAEDNKNGL